MNRSTETLCLVLFIALILWPSDTAYHRPSARAPKAHPHYSIQLPVWVSKAAFCLDLPAQFIHFLDNIGLVLPRE